MAGSVRQYASTLVVRWYGSRVEPTKERTHAREEHEEVVHHKVHEGPDAQGPRRAPPVRVHWGSGQIIEEASFTGQYTEPSIQLLEYEEGGHGIRFCYYSLDGRFQRSPMMIDSTTNLKGLRDALKSTPKLRALLKKMVG